MGHVRHAAGRVPAGARELALVALVFAAYKLGRLITADDVSSAFGNSLSVVAFESWLHLPNEASLQDWAMGFPDVVRASNSYYAWVHFPVTALVLLWTWWHDRPAYLWLRRSLVGLTAFALVLHVMVPLAPPRMFPELGYTDTGLLLGQSVYASSVGQSLSNQYAAMPSLHVGWSIWVALVLVLVLRTRWRWLVLLHPLMTSLVVVVTANHFWVDGLVAACALAVIVPLSRLSWCGVGRVDVRPEALPATSEPARQPVGLRCPRQRSGEPAGAPARDA
jgi:hypothetical protein